MTRLSYISIAYLKRLYRIPVTTALLQVQAASSYPKEETTVLRYIPPVPHQHRYSSDLDNRRITVLRSLFSLECTAVSDAFMQN